MQSKSKQPTITLLSSSDWKEYELIDSGNGKKFERFGPYRFIRPESQALWHPSLPKQEWEKADAKFQDSSGDTERGKWIFNRAVEPEWNMHYKHLTFSAQPTPFRHMGVFPEQAVHWDWMSDVISTAKRPVRVLNLFGYTGIATLSAASAGASVTHVDASKKAISWARQNQRLSHLEDTPIRWILDDALKFVEREVRRGNQYDGIILDPPKFGRGPKGEVWKLDNSLPSLLSACKQLLSKTPLFVVLTVYALRISSVNLYYLLDELCGNCPGEITTGETILVEKSAGRMLSPAIFSRFSCTTKNMVA